ncbi:MAG TPA: cysteine--tRNA ligase [Phycisphaerae bacterium]|nr:cysteine--tRNA ligase [Phycisphaerae bacterium]
MTLRVYNTLTGEKELFETVRPGKVGIYLCGPTVYRPAHIGHAVGPVIFDVIKRYLAYKGYQVTWVVNITDVEDKLIAEAQERGVTVMALAQDLEQKYIDAMGALGIRSIDHMPRASEHIGEIIAHIRQLIERGMAYEVEGDVYFDVSKDADYGKLTHRRPEEQSAGAREGLDHSAKRNPGDFALWKAAKAEEPDEVKFDSPWGKGRPGWHIECSAMAMKYLGDTFDIHGGGMDLKFPHHENEIAQAESATGKPFAKYWMHNGLTRFNTKKISKSDPEFQKIMTSLQLSNLLAKYPAELLRFLIIQSQYRSPIDFTEETIQSAKTGLSAFYRLLERIHRVTGEDPYSVTLQIERMRDSDAGPEAAKFIDDVMNQQVRFLEAMDDDFNTAGAIGSLFDLAGLINRFIDASRVESRAKESSRLVVQAAGGTFVNLARILGLLVERPPETRLADDSKMGRLVDLLVEVRNMARKSKQFEIADSVRRGLADMGISLEDRSDGTQWRLD